jgi:hypothetical protein
MVQWTAKIFAETDMATAESVGQQESHGHPEEGKFEDRLLGQWGELAFKMEASLPLIWHPIYSLDSPIAEVKTVSKDFFGVMYREDDIWKGPDCRFVSVSAEHFPEMRIRGWMTGRELRTDRCWKNGTKIKNKRDRVYLGDPSQFHPITSSAIFQEWMDQYESTIDGPKPIW